MQLDIPFPHSARPRKLGITDVVSFIWRMAVLAVLGYEAVRLMTWCGL